MTALAYPGVTFGETGLAIEPGLSFDEWSGLMSTLQAMRRRIDFWLGDAAIYGETYFGDSYAQAISESSGFSEESVRQAQWVAEKIPPPLRRNGLSFSHHRAVAALEPEEREAWLDKAESDGLTSRELYQRSRTATAETGNASDSLADDVRKALRRWLADADLIAATDAVVEVLRARGVAV